MKIQVNGEKQEVSATSLQEILNELGFADAKIATAVNEEFVPAAARQSCQLEAGDRLEIVAPRQGG